MRRFQTAFNALLLSVATLLMWSSSAQAQQSSESHKWTVEAGPQLVQISSEGIHVNQPDPKGLTYYGIVSTHINLPTGKPWKIAFDLKFGQLRSAGAAIGLFAGPNLIGWISADGWYKQMGCFVGKSNEIAALPANMDWHNFQFSSDGTTVTVTEDGNVIGSGPQSGTPDTIKIGDINGSAQPSGAQPTKMLEGQQSELWMRKLAASTSDMLSHSLSLMQASASSPDLSQLRHELALKDAIIAALRLQLAGHKNKKGQKSRLPYQEVAREQKQNQAAAVLQASAETQLTQVNVNVQVSVTQPEVSHDASVELASQVASYNRLLDRVRLLTRDEDNCLDVAQRCLTWVRLNDYASPETRLSVLGIGQGALRRSDQDSSSLKSCLYQALALYKQISVDASFARLYAEGDYGTTAYYLDDDLRVQGAQYLRYITAR